MVPQIVQQQQGKAGGSEIETRLRKIAHAGFAEGLASETGTAEAEEAATEAAVQEAMAALKWHPIETAPKDGTRFWGNDGDDAVAMLWHEGFQAFVSSWRRMTMAPGLLIDGLSEKDHSPVEHQPTCWMPMPSPLEETPTKKIAEAKS